MPGQVTKRRQWGCVSAFTFQAGDKMERRSPAALTSALLRGGRRQGGQGVSFGSESGPNRDGTCSVQGVAHQGILLPDGAVGGAAARILLQVVNTERCPQVGILLLVRVTPRPPQACHRPPGRVYSYESGLRGQRSQRGPT